MSEKSGFEELMSQVDGFVFHPLTLGLLGFAVFCMSLVLALNQIRTGKFKPIRFSQTWWLNALGWFAVCFAPVLMALLLAVLAMLSQVGWRILSGDTIQKITTPQGTIEDGADNLRWYVLAFVGLLTALAGIIGTPLTLIRIWTVERQTKNAELLRVDGRIQKAFETLGAYREESVNGMNTIKPNTEARIGALLTLQTVACQNPEHLQQIIQLLSLYIKENAPNKIKENAPNKQIYSSTASFPIKHKNVRSDIQIAVDILFRGTSENPGLHSQVQQREKMEKTVLTGSDLSGVSFRFGNLHGAILNDCKLVRCDFRDTNLSFARFWKSDCRASDFSRSEMVCSELIAANLDHSSIVDSNLSFATLSRSSFRSAILSLSELRYSRTNKADFEHAIFKKTDISNTRFVRANLGDVRFTSAEMDATIFEKCSLSKSNFSNANSSNVTFYKSSLNDVRNIPVGLVLPIARSREETLFTSMQITSEQAPEQLSYKDFRRIIESHKSQREKLLEEVLQSREK